MKSQGSSKLLKSLNLGWLLGIMLISLIVLTIAANIAAAEGRHAPNDIVVYELSWLGSGSMQQGGDRLRDQDRDQDRLRDQDDCQSLEGNPQQDRDQDQDQNQDRDRDQTRDGS